MLDTALLCFDLFQFPLSNGLKKKYPHWMFEGMHGLKTGATDHVGEEMRKQVGAWELFSEAQRRVALVPTPASTFASPAAHES